MIFVAQIRGMLLGQTDEVSTIEEGIALVKRIVEENGIKMTPEVVKEIENDWSYLDQDLEWSVCIGQTE